MAGAVLATVGAVIGLSAFLGYLHGFSALRT
jgi:uncharacterized membrane protein required for colicin V production